MNKLQAKNEAVINASTSKIWSVITDISLLHKVNPGVVKATGKMDTLQSTRTCEINNNGRMGTMTERLVELIPEKKTVWSIESDSMGMSKILKHTRFVFNLEKLPDGKTKVTTETYYRPANLLASLMNQLMMKRMISSAQEKILNNLKSLTEN